VTDLCVRRYEPGDADAVWDLHERALRDVGAYDEAYAHLDADLRAVREAYFDAGGTFLVGERDGHRRLDAAHRDEVAVHESDPATGVVRRMRVDPAHQRQGYGATILRELEARARDRGFERLVLDTRPDQTAAIALYESFGYEETGREPVEATDDTIVYYRKEL